MSTRSSTLIAAAQPLAIVKHAAPAYSRSQAVIDVLAAEDVAEALQRVSCVSIAREFGEGERVSIRVLRA